MIVGVIVGEPSPRVPAFGQMHDYEVESLCGQAHSWAIAARSARSTRSWGAPPGKPARSSGQAMRGCRVVGQSDVNAEDPREPRVGGDVVTPIARAVFAAQVFD